MIYIATIAYLQAGIPIIAPDFWEVGLLSKQEQ
jgi:hypothetical protein